MHICLSTQARLHLCNGTGLSSDSFICFVEEFQFFFLHGGAGQQTIWGLCIFRVSFGILFSQDPFLLILIDGQSLIICWINEMKSGTALGYKCYKAEGPNLAILGL
ncbi:hypothetical protein DUNSADRAFT_15661 [Dunaliella salina]|uniref:Uncharacterized protein n=1 Tax=Dunaliella salina TaxID=3046 RepID=A0ABQ7G512_DUNSA|nr:hypothetical protein DUNSADRAFT_15661 [Dunaliella salina]|eukprot:KAF5829686.1 hypothetical protein DUNSADRAFT_15661 [Dunaliella salina]